MAHLDLVKTVRALDQENVEAVPEQLKRLWIVLSTSSGGSFHAAEAIILRWLLKLMNGSSPSAEKIRRWPLTWSILGYVFQRIPLFSLAKSLADRRFVSVLQQTVKDLATARNGASPRKQVQSDTDMMDAPASQFNDNPRKRKRAHEAPFDLDALSEQQSCLRSAETLFEALRMLLGRLGTEIVDRHSNDKMGAEHIKSLFSSSSTETMEIVAPLLHVCNQALTDQEPEAFENQDSWIRTLVALWNLHLQGQTDAFDVATHLSPTGCIMLGRLLSIPSPYNVSVETQVRLTWANDLQKFLTRNLILPARSAFINKGDTGMVSVAIGETASTTSLKSSILLHLALNAPRLIGNATAKADNEKWMQKLFQMVEEPVRDLAPDKRNQVVSKLLDLSAQHSVAPSWESLRSVCSDYAFRDGMTDWHLLSSVAKCDVDAFLVSSKGAELLELIIERMPQSGHLQEASNESASAFLVALAEGYANARDLLGFMRKWFENLGKCDIDSLRNGTAGHVWFNREIRNTVARLLQASLSTSQLLTLLEELEPRIGQAEDVARLIVFDAISAGVKAEEYQEAIKTRLFNHLPKYRAQRSLPPEILAISWRVISRTLCWVDVHEAQRIWAEIETPLDVVLKNELVADIQTFEAFKCSLISWNFLKFTGDGELKARDLIARFLLRFSQEIDSLSITETFLLQPDACKSKGEGELIASSERELDLEKPSVASYVVWILSGSSRLMDCIIGDFEEGSQFLTALFSSAATCLAQDPGRRHGEALITLLLSHLRKAQNQSIKSDMIDRIIGILKNGPIQDTWSQQHRSLIRVLLQTPKQDVTRPQRERIVPLLLSLCTTKEICRGALVHTEDWMLVLSMMAKLTSAPTFYKDMDFKDLVVLGDSLDLAMRDKSLPDALKTAGVFRHVAMQMVRQMMSAHGERGSRYISGINAVVADWASSSLRTASPLILLDACLSVTGDLPTSKSQSSEAVDSGVLQKTLAGGIVSALEWITTESSMNDIMNDHEPRLLSTWVALDVFKNNTTQQYLNERLISHLMAIKTASDALAAEGLEIGWKLKIFLTQHFSKHLGHPDELQFHGLFHGIGYQSNIDEAAMLPETASDLLRDCLRAQTRHYTDEKLLSYLRDLILGLNQGEKSVGRLTAIYYIVKQLSGSIDKTSSVNFDLGTAHSMLVQLLPRSESPTEFGIAANVIGILLAEKSTSMGQWNIEATLSCVSTVCLDAGVADNIKASPATYTQLCHLVEVIIKRNRLRIEGHFHLLIQALQALLTYLIIHPKTSSSSLPNRVGQQPFKEFHWQKHAKRFSRLLELVCEPSVASVTRAQKNLLHSATEAAKRSAGQHMYLVLMAYIKLQLEHVVPHDVREALEPGMFSILSITSAESRNVINDAVDQSGRVIFRETYRRWQKFGKWKGV